jgi:hypothetical protein
MQFYVAMADINYFDSEGEYKKYTTYNHIKAESEEQAKMILLRFIENDLGKNEWEWEDEDIYIASAQRSDEEIEFRGYLSADKFGGLSKDKFSKGRFAEGGGVKSRYVIVLKNDDGSELIQYTDAFNLMDATKQAKLVSDILKKRVINVYLVDDEVDIEKYRSQAKRMMKRMGTLDNGGGVDGEKYYMLFNISEFKGQPIYNFTANSKQEVIDILLESYENITKHKMYSNEVYSIKDMDESKYNSYINDDYAYVTANAKEYDRFVGGYKSVAYQSGNYAEGGGISGLDDLIRG